MRLSMHRRLINPPPAPLFQRGEGCHDSRKARLMEEYSRPATGKILERALETFRKRSE